MKGLRGTALDPFGSRRVRRVERALIGEYRALVERALARLSADTHDMAVEIADLPDMIRGYEDIKLENVTRFGRRRGSSWRSLADRLPTAEGPRR